MFLPVVLNKADYLKNYKTRTVPNFTTLIERNIDFHIVTFPKDCIYL